VRGRRGHWVDVERQPEDEAPPGFVVLRVEGGLFFANAEHVRATVLDRVDEDTKAVVLDAQTMPLRRRQRGTDAARAGRRPPA
jgi:sulfate permease, SulP family